MKDLLSDSLEKAGQLTALRRELHACPETGFYLPRTAAIVRRVLAAAGCEARELPKGGVVSVIRGGKPGKTILLRADMDALPMREESGLPFAAAGNAAHCCGHELHTTMLLGAAALLKDRQDQLCGNVKLMFQPAEEPATGAAQMLADGVLSDPRVDAALAMHVAPQRRTGTFNCHGGYIMASYDRFAITVEGQSGHGAMPDRTVDPIATAIQIHEGLQTLISRECPPSEATVLTIGSFHAGTAGNVIPKIAIMEGTARSENMRQRDFVMRRLCEYTEGIAAAHRAAGSCTVLSSLPPLYNDEKMAPVVAGYIRQLLGSDAVDEERDYRSSSEDFALIATRVPSVYLHIGTGLAEDGYRYENHHAKVLYDESVLPLGSAVFAHCAMRWLADNAEAPGI